MKKNTLALLLATASLCSSSPNIEAALYCKQEANKDSSSGSIESTREKVASGNNMWDIDGCKIRRKDISGEIVYYIDDWKIRKKDISGEIVYVIDDWKIRKKDISGEIVYVID